MHSYREVELNLNESNESTKRLIPIFILVMIAGGLGAISRVALGLVVEVGANGFPWGTFISNMLGAFGLVWIRLRANDPIWQHVWCQRVVGTGFFGAFTTFSALGNETWLLFEFAGWFRAGWYVGLSLIGGALMALIATKWFAKKAVE